MKKHLKYIGLFLGILILVGSCKKYPEGPKLSFKTVKHRLSGNWELIRFEVGGIDSLSVMEYKTFEIGHKYKGKGLRYTDFNPIGTYGYTGFIGVFSHKEEVGFVDNNKQETNFITKHLLYDYKSVYGDTLKLAKYKILKLTDKEFKIRSYITSVKSYLIEFKKLK